MKIEVGDVVEMNNGEVHKVDRMLGGDPDHVNVYGYGPFVIDEVRYHQDGRFGCHGFEHHLSVKRIISRASDDTQSSQEGEPKLWREMTDAEKGALLLAHHEGKVIEYYSPSIQKWIYEEPPFFIENLEAENARLRDALSNIAVVGFSEDSDVARAIARQTVEQARAALEEKNDD